MIKERIIYLGNGEERIVKELDGQINLLDIYKVKEMLEKYGEVKVGASVDWSFTAQILTKEDIPDLFSGKKLLLRSSCWDRFKIVLPTGEELDATITVDEKIYNLIFTDGFSKAISKMLLWFGINIYFDLILKLEYEQIEEMVNKVKPILKEYEDLARRKR